jgi:pyruvate dehydrogenase E2 component (dihydrolipoamide acetyltransferase)
MAEIFAVEHGRGGAPIVLLHGFGGSHAAWDGVVAALAGARHTIAFDLPGHADSLAARHGSSAVAAKAILAELERRELRRCHLVGHSMGGAVAALVALKAPQLVGSLTLLSPGGFGREINSRLLRRYAAANEEAAIALLLEQFFGWSNPVPSGLAAAQAAERRAAGATRALRQIVETFFDGDVQKILPLADIAALNLPIKVVWGTQDRVLPTRQAHRLPGRIAVHIFERVGHMLPHEIPVEVAHLILENTR